VEALLYGSSGGGIALLQRAPEKLGAVARMAWL
jgi:hypothetical protein